MRLIAADGSNKGLVDTRDALHQARVQHLDLIEVAPNAEPPVCRIFDYGKFIYEREKKEREAKKNLKVTEIKGVRLRPKTTDHHLSFKIRSARRFLQQGNKVKVSLRFKGREDQIPHVARRMMDKVSSECADLAIIEFAPQMEGKTMLMVLAPTAATVAASTLKSTQVRIQEELEVDKAQGYIEDDDDEDDEDEIEVLDAVEDADSNGVPKDKSARKAINRVKRARERSQEQFNLP
ncbi:MAG: translation initiation factor IF-3 [Chloroflexi bacterium]|nr:translation initiation factor IF-3 [Chloroflexota bacterium]MCL5273689.1 translation initiation factor IF-3 [Chloroflexota bacterium]